ncbi:toll/interleukin-1 receptor domain-containing protein [Cryptosporangium aurantiacum]|uniref:TIR domain-containing protein n=1 Tax=Cryptosporangium aurantiacum TaxID=134849 RepID=A0A1M7TX18_9ACTN|nr:toll/interleukin-1 receptor domain-containing protein [Cryptosporangium aurantiacum]SHN75268.1 TIR domain-containing protein [Cryptosporangium aurantiacum]
MAHSTDPARPPVFISYRRRDTANVAGRLADRLAQEHGEDRVFLDVDSTQIGADVVSEVRRRIRASGVLVMLIGYRWHGPRVTGPRLHDPEDVVRIEIEEARRFGVPVVPVLVDGAPMPSATQLPPSIQDVARLAAARLRYDMFRYDVVPLLETIRRILGARAGSGRPRGTGRSRGGGRVRRARPRRRRRGARTAPCPTHPADAGPR